MFYEFLGSEHDYSYMYMYIWWYKNTTVTGLSTYTRHIRSINLGYHLVEGPLIRKDSWGGYMCMGMCWGMYIGLWVSEVERYGYKHMYADRSNHPHHDDDHDSWSMIHNLVMMLHSTYCCDLCIVHTPYIQSKHFHIYIRTNQRIERKKRKGVNSLNYYVCM